MYREYLRYTTNNCTMQTPWNRTARRCGCRCALRTQRAAALLRCEEELHVAVADRGGARDPQRALERFGAPRRWPPLKTRLAYHRECTPSYQCIWREPAPSPKLEPDKSGCKARCKSAVFIGMVHTLVNFYPTASECRNTFAN